MPAEPFGKRAPPPASSTGALGPTRPGPTARPNALSRLPCVNGPTCRPSETRLPRPSHATLAARLQHPAPSCSPRRKAALEQAEPGRPPQLRQLTRAHATTGLTIVDARDLRHAPW